MKGIEYSRLAVNSGGMEKLKRKPSMVQAANYSAAAFYLKAVKENDAIMTAIADWTSQYQITYNEENILAATEAAKALEPDDDTMEAVPTDDEEAVEVPGVTEAPN